ncbi:hypothetical protein H0A73_20090 [Alcaligenaceae bacterium]|nr:hypothetical protein [Alcaligenaceae bacterium]
MTENHKEKTATSGTDDTGTPLAMRVAQFQRLVIQTEQALRHTDDKRMLIAFADIKSIAPGLVEDIKHLRESDPDNPLVVTFGEFMDRAQNLDALLHGLTAEGIREAGQIRIDPKARLEPQAASILMDVWTSIYGETRYNRSLEPVLLPQLLKIQAVASALDRQAKSVAAIQEQDDNQDMERADRIEGKIDRLADAVASLGVSAARAEERLRVVEVNIDHLDIKVGQVAGDVVTLSNKHGDLATVVGRIDERTLNMQDQWQRHGLTKVYLWATMGITAAGSIGALWAIFTQLIK